MIFILGGYRVFRLYNSVRSVRQFYALIGADLEVSNHLDDIVPGGSLKSIVNGCNNSVSRMHSCMHP